MAWSAAIMTAALHADYSQVELHPGPGGYVVELSGVGLATSEFGDPAVLTVARQSGTLAFEVHLVETEPAPDPSWDAAVEFSLRTGDGMSLTGWGRDTGIVVGVPPGVDLRVRYVVLDGQLAQDDEETLGHGPGPDRYLLQMWPAAPAPPQILASTSPWSQYWTFAQPAIDLVDDLATIPDPGRLVHVVDRALADHPDVAQRLRDGDLRYRLGVIRYAQELFSLTYASGAYRDFEDNHDLLLRLIDDRAAIPPH